MGSNPTHLRLKKKPKTLYSYLYTKPFKLIKRFMSSFKKFQLNVVNNELEENRRILPFSKSIFCLLTNPSTYMIDAFKYINGLPDPLKLINNWKILQIIFFWLTRSRIFMFDLCDIIIEI